MAGAWHVMLQGNGVGGWGCGIRGVRWWLLGEGLLLGGVNGWGVVVMVLWCEGGWVDGGETGE